MMIEQLEMSDPPLVGSRNRHLPVSVVIGWLAPDGATYCNIQWAA